MAVHIRMTRIGRRNLPFYRIGAYDSKSKRNGNCLENLGWYNPVNNNEDVNFKINLERVEYWLSKGAMPTEKTYALLKKAGIRFHPQKQEAK